MTDWEDLSQRDQRRWISTMAALAGHGALEDPETPARAKPVQREHAEGLQLVAWARATWWGHPDYFRHHEQAVQGRTAGGKRRAAGQAPGWPDYTLIVPAMPEGRPDGTSTLTLAALELKAPQHAPKRDVPHEWWLEWGEECHGKRESGGWEWDGRASEPTRYGVRASQAICLWVLSGAGFRTKVAYGASEAFEWLSAAAGER